ncbi:MAG: bifunctional 2-polyprenyl-6-hydroxyphenol methylase/3-demethylubiquinol 3-O-methyltransferase UbiG [Hyphomonadaceae bacterium]
MSQSTLDPEEIRKFSALAAEWWNPKGPFGALHRLNPVRLRYIRDIAMRHFKTSARRPLDGVSALDLGCGGGLVAAPLARMGAKLSAIDASAEAIGAARSYAEQASLEIAYECATAEALVERGETFQFVTALEIIEHVADVGVFLAAAGALVAPGGVLVLSTINRTQKAHALAIVAAERVLNWAPAGAHDYDKLVTPEEIRAGAADLVWDEPVGLSFNPFGNGWSLSRDISMNYIIAGIRPETA